MEVVLPSDIGSDRADGDFPGVGEERSDEKRFAKFVKRKRWRRRILGDFGGQDIDFGGKEFKKVVSWTRFLVGLIWTFEARK